MEVPTLGFYFGVGVLFRNDVLFLVGVVLYWEGTDLRFSLSQDRYIAQLIFGKQVMSELDFAAEILPKSVKLLAVTGTNGKSTVVTFAGQGYKYMFAFVLGIYALAVSEAVSENCW
ncbi:hypothetical protein GBA52_008395 [Prunus armeniaca]|nr:hypothetical protein GBA52_008395 [Prunus armeniaca]